MRPAQDQAEAKWAILPVYESARQRLHASVKDADLTAEVQEAAIEAELTWEQAESIDQNTRNFVSQYEDSGSFLT